MLWSRTWSIGEILLSERQVDPLTVAKPTALLVLFFGLAVATQGNETPAAPVTGFYTKYLILRPSGLPTRAQERDLAPYLSQRLLHLMKEARRHQEDLIRKNPDEKPPWIDGCLFASLFEGPNRFMIEQVLAQPDGSYQIKVHFWYEEGREGWIDTAIVRREAGRLVIDDFLLSGAGPFNPPHRLSDSLKWREQ